MVVVRCILIVKVVSFIAVSLHGCAGNCSDESCKFDGSKANNIDKKEQIDTYIQCQNNKDCCVPVNTGHKLASEAKALNHRKQDVEDMEKCQ